MNNIITELSKFSDYIDNCKKDVNISISDSRIVSTLRWLFEVQEENGSWDHGSVASTSICILAIESLRLPTSGWELNDTINEVLKKAIDFLSLSYKRNHWEDDVWDTAIAVRALTKTKLLDSHKLAEEPLQWLRTLSIPGNLSPHHIAQVAMAFAEAGADRNLLEKTIESLKKCFRECKLDYSPYVLAQVAEALCLKSAKSKIIDCITKTLIKSLKNAALDNANFLNICLALQGLYTINPYQGFNAFRITSGSLFGPFCFRENGSWYQSPWYTGWALLTLSRYSKEVVVTVPYSELYYEYNLHVKGAENKLFSLQKKETLNLMWNLLFGILWGGLFAFFITYTTLQNNMYEWIKWIIGFFLGSSFLAYLPFFCKKIKALKEGKKHELS